MNSDAIFTTPEFGPLTLRKEILARAWSSHRRTIRLRNATLIILQIAILLRLTMVCFDIGPHWLAIDHGVIHFFAATFALLAVTTAWMSRQRFNNAKMQFRRFRQHTSLSLAAGRQINRSAA